MISLNLHKKYNTPNTVVLVEISMLHQSQKSYYKHGTALL